MPGCVDILLACAPSQSTRGPFALPCSGLRHFWPSCIPSPKIPESRRAWCAWLTSEARPSLSGASGWPLPAGKKKARIAGLGSADTDQLVKSVIVRPRLMANNSRVKTQYRARRLSLAP